MDEYIERESAIRRIRELAAITGFENPAVAIDSAIAVIERTKTEDVAPVRHGRWIKHEDGVFTCSECGNAESNESYFCRYCGAKMDGDPHD